MTKILRRISEYTFDEFKEFCSNNGIDYHRNMYYCRTWAIEQHECDLQIFINSCNRKTIVTVNGCIYLNNKHHKVKPKTLTLADAFDKMITTDIQDYSIVLSPGGTYYVIALHSKGHNVFKFRLDNDENGKTTSSN